ncbi:MAG: Xaa-Pro peptidase family protein [Dysgonomonas sp.]|nr:Xaa-Pro peptidase family protein [Dysgonomonas sp.]
MEYNIALSADIKMRHRRIQDEMQKSEIDACILTTSVNVFYVVGGIYNGYFYLPAEGKPIHFLKRITEIELEDAISIRKPEQIPDELEKRGLKIPRKVLLETDAISYTECNRLISSLNIPEVANGSVFMRQLRSVKSQFEIEQIRHCAKKHEAVYREIPNIYRSGMTDLELQFEVEHLMRKHGSLGLFRSYGASMDIFMGSLLVGENAESPSPFDFALGGKGENPVLPLGASGEKIKKGNTIMVDMAGNYSPWMTDMTRVFSAGKTLDIAYRAHQVSIDINNHIMDMAKPGVAVAELYNIAMQMVEDNKLEEYFMGTKQQAKFVGHGVGLEINEPPVLTPRSKEILVEGTVFALEPKFVIPEVGAVGIENTYLITSDGIEKLTILDEEIMNLEG